MKRPALDEFGEPVNWMEILELQIAREDALARRAPPREFGGPDPKLLGVAYHESGHAVAAAAAGLAVAHIMVHNVTIDGPWLPGYHNGRMVPRYPTDAPVGSQVMILMAGGAAEERHQPQRRFPEVGTGDVRDREIATGLLARHFDRAPDDPVIAAELRRHRRWAERVIDTHWGWCERVAQRLAVARRLTGEEIEALRGRP